MKSASVAEFPPAAVSAFQGVALQEGDESLALPSWTATDWEDLFRHTRILDVEAGKSVIEQGALDRGLYFVISGLLEVVVLYEHGVTVGPLTRVPPGSVAGEQAFLDGSARSAYVWAVTKSILLRLEPDDFQAFAVTNPEKAHELLMAVARILAIRLRNTTARIAR